MEGEQLRSMRTLAVTLNGRRFRLPTTMHLRRHCGTSTWITNRSYGPSTVCQKYSLSRLKMNPSISSYARRLLVCADYCGMPSPQLITVPAVIPSSDPERMLNLNCWVHGDEPQNVFPVKIARDETVGALKKAIKEEKKPLFDHIPADSLELWKVSNSDRCVLLQ